MNEPTHLDLFSGIGGFALAAQWAGFRTIGFCEIDKYCRKVLAKNFLADPEYDGGTQTKVTGEDHKAQQGSSTGTKLCGDESARVSGSWESGFRGKIFGNIFDLNGADFSGVSLITGGFPCQPFSVAGKRGGAADDRAIWPEMFRVISEARPAWVLGENVPGIIPMELDNVLSDLEGIGYATRAFVIPACAVDARHRRDRVWIVGRRIGDATDPNGIGRDAKFVQIRLNQESERQPSGSSTFEREDGLRRRERFTRESQSEFCGISNGLPEELDSTINRDMMGYAKTDVARREEELRTLRKGTQTETVRQQPRGSCEIQTPKVLRSIVHGETLHAGASNLGGTQEKSGEISREEMRNVRDGEERRHSSLEQQSIGQHSEQSNDPMRLMSHKMALEEWKAKWPEESIDIPRVAHGIPSRVDRLKGLGNAIVSQVAYEILREIRKLI